MIIILRSKIQSFKYQNLTPRTVRLTIRVGAVFWFMNFFNRSFMIINYIDSSRMSQSLWYSHVWKLNGLKTQNKTKGRNKNIFHERIT